ncbi:MAG: GNAT family N-acetyltransferase [Bacteroidota bacterium]
MIRKFVAQDLDAVRDILVKSAVFSTEEIMVALEVIEAYLGDQKQQDYDLYTAVDDQERIVGYVCIGPTPISYGTFDLYWIVVHPGSHGKGIGRDLLIFAENLVKSRGGRLMVAETSSLPRYEKARRFYEANQYSVLARIKEYYNVGDDLVIYGKYFR